MSGALRSAALMILPRVWAMMEPASETAPHVQPKRAHGLSLVGAPTKPPAAVPVVVNLRAGRAIPTPQLAFYRKYTESMLERCLGMSLEAARVPSLMGRELFRGNVSHSRTTGFDDVVHFVLDMENCMKLLSPGKQHLMRRIAMQGYSQGEAAAMLGISLSTTVRRYNEGLDELTAILIDRGLLQPATLSPDDHEEHGGREDH